MEDFSTVIWIIAIVAAMVFNGVSKARKQAKRHAPQGDRHAGSEAWPSWDEASAPDSSPAEPHPAQRTQRAELQPATMPEAQLPGYGETTPEMADYMQSERLRSHNTIQTGSRLAQKNKKQPAEADEANETAPDNEMALDIENFDLRKAVIYSEILKPKFYE